MNTRIVSPVVATFPAFDSNRWATAQHAREALDLDTLPTFDESVVLAGDHAILRRLDSAGNETHRKVIQFRTVEPVQLALVPEPVSPARSAAGEALAAINNRRAPKRVIAAPKPSWWAWLFR